MKTPSEGMWNGDPQWRGAGYGPGFAFSSWAWWSSPVSRSGRAFSCSCRSSSRAPLL